MQELEVDFSVNDISTTGNESSSFIIDLMALVQSTVTQNSILFGDLVVCLSQTVTNVFRYVNTWLSAQIHMMLKNSLNASKDHVEERLLFLKEKLCMRTKNYHLISKSS